uniref:SAM domain-containing protein n=1 Tax=Mantoniella antarctica TaxID=81844 RepID=A0A7S0X8B0_9CHLO
MPPGSAARRVRVIRIEALLDELGTELTQAVAHNAGAGATMLQTIQETMECRRSDVEASTEAALAARESLDADVAAFASAAAALDAQETRVQNRHIADVAALRGMHGTKLKRVDEAFRAAAEDVATNTALIRAKYAAEERQLVDDLPRRLRPVQDEQGALQRRRDDLNGRAVKVRDEEVFVAALVKDLSFHEEHTRGEASALMIADEALRTIRTEVVDLRDHAKEMPGEDLNNVVSYAKALNVASMRVTPVEYEQKITTKLFVVKSFLSKITTKINKGPQDQNKKEVGSSRGDGGSRIGNGERTEDLDSFEKRLYADAASWSPAAVRQWMETEGFETWGEVFEGRQVDGSLLLGLSFGDLEDELDVKGRKERKAIWKAIERLRQFQKSESDVVVEKKKGFFSNVLCFGVKNNHF